METTGYDRQRCGHLHRAVPSRKRTKRRNPNGTDGRGVGSGHGRLCLSPLAGRRFAPRQQRFELRAFGGFDHVIGVEPEDVIAGSVFQCSVAGGGEVINPGEMKNLCSELAGDFDSSIAAAGIDDHNLVE